MKKESDQKGGSGRFPAEGKGKNPPHWGMLLCLL